MSNFKLRIKGALPQGLAWSAGFNMVSTAPVATVASTLNAAWTTAWTDAANGIEKFVAADVTTVDTVVYAVDANWRTLQTVVTPNAQVGTNVNVTPNLASSPYMSFTGALDTKSYTGRFKFPPFASNQISAGLILNATCDSIGTVMSTFFASMLGLAGSSIVSHNVRTNKQNDPPGTTHILTGGTMKNRPGTERARERKLKATHVATITF
jgi:hypothetical protein